MISTLKKMPWYMSEYITFHQRYSVFRATTSLIRLLQQAIGEQRNLEVLNNQLLKRLYTAAMLCPGFTVQMKDDVAYLVDLSDLQQQREFNQPRFPDSWVHTYALCPKPGTSLDVIEWYISVIREETNRTVLAMPLAQRNTAQALARSANQY